MQENNSIKQAFPDPAINDWIRETVQQRAGSLHIRHRNLLRTRRTVACSIVSLGLFVGVTIIGPKAYAFYGMQRIGGALDDCKSMIMEHFDLGKDGKYHSSRITMYSQGKWRMEDHGSTQVYENQTLWRYDPELNQITKKIRPEGPFSFNSSGTSIKAMLADDIRFGWKSKTTLSSGELEGKPAELLTIEHSMSDSREVVYADPKSHMPIKISMESMQGSQWKESGYINFKFNSTIDKKFFEPHFPESAKVIDIEKVKRDWKSKLEKIIVTFKTDEGMIALRDIAVTERGHVFLVYTNGETAKDRKAYGDTMRSGNIPTEYYRPFRWSVEDTVGNSYWPSSKTDFQPYVGPIGNNREEHIVLKNGQVLQGAWLIPSMPNKWSPREITLKCWTPKADKYAGTYTFKIQSPTDKLIPDWMAVCAMGPHKAEQIYQEESGPQARIGVAPSR